MTASEFPLVAVSISMARKWEKEVSRNFAKETIGFCLDGDLDDDTMRKNKEENNCAR